jgi:dihydrofolate reductase
MGKLTVTCFITLDNVVEDPQLWSFDFQSDDAGAYNTAVLQEADAMLLGRRTYEGFAAAWPSRSGDPYSDKFNAMPKHVATRTLDALDWSNSHAIEGDLVEAARTLKADRNVLIWGSPSTVDQLAAAGVVDEYQLLISPIVRGSGIRLWDGVDAQVGYRVAETTQLSGGMLAVKLVANA